MKIRSITYFANPGWPLQESIFRSAGEFASAARLAFQSTGYEVQTIRLATVPFPSLVVSDDKQSLAQMAGVMETAARQAGFEYLSMGPALPEYPQSYVSIPEALAVTENVFFAGSLSTPDRRISLPAVRACAEVIHRIAPISSDGFANLRFAALANVPAGSPFFPAAYHQGTQAAFALATEAADLAVEAFATLDNLADARSRLVQSVEAHALALERVCKGLVEEFGVTFGGLDFSLAPFPEQSRSLGEAMERLGVPAVGQFGSLAAAAILTETLDRANFHRTGFNGLFLPVLEDAVLASRAAKGQLTVQDLLVYAAVCGTGLDTIPLPGDTSREALSALLLDLAALAHRLNKPLTARLMPIPGKKAGDPIHFDFAYFANCRVMALEAKGLGRYLAGDEDFPLASRALL